MKALAQCIKVQRSFLSVNSELRSLVYFTSQKQSANGTETDTNREIQHHANHASDWWNPNGPMQALHAMNAIRVPFIREGLISTGNVDPNLINTDQVLKCQNILEVGCGGGILSEQLARLHATVTGIDPGSELIAVAQQHMAVHSPDLCERLSYCAESVDVHVRERMEYYDAVVVSEVLEHIDDKPAFLTSCVQALKPRGSIFITTPNKTLPMWIGGILIGEYILNIAPKGTHHWNKLISPLDVQRILDTLNCQTILVNGAIYDFWRNTWRWINSNSFCYALHAVKCDDN